MQQALHMLEALDVISEQLHLWIAASEQVHA